MQTPPIARKIVAALTLALTMTPLTAHAWWEKGHKLVGNIATDHLTPIARRNVEALLGTESLADVASWADVYRPLESQTSGWHFTDVPGDSDVYNRDRDCPVQPGVKLGARNDVWRDCATDRILFFEKRIADPKLDPSDRAIALKYLVHFVGDIHQPLHASGVEIGGNTIPLTAFGSPSCSTGGKCNLHNIWDGYLIDHRNLTDAQYLARLEAEIRTTKLVAGSNDPVVWTNESKVISDKAIVPKNSEIDEAYFNREIPVIDRQLELAGLRLASLLNAAFTTPPVAFHPPATTDPQ
jgi:hypothetical protein